MLMLGVQKVAADLCGREGFWGGPLLGVHGSLQLLYHARPNQFERFRGFLELISRFEFECCRRGNIF